MVTAHVVGIEPHRQWDRRLTANSRAKDANVGNQAELPAGRLLEKAPGNLSLAHLV
jgi:hypothetical protein